MKDTAEATTTGRVAEKGTPGGGGGASIEDRRIGTEEVRRIPRRKREKRQGEGVRASKGEAVMTVMDNEADGRGKREGRVSIRKGEWRLRHGGKGEGKVNKATGRRR